MSFCFAAKFTEFPRNVTATEGQNVEMSCAFQSGSASVYLEIQWWFLRGPEDLEPAAEVAGAQVAERSRVFRSPAVSVPLTPSLLGVQPEVCGPRRFPGATWKPPALLGGGEAQGSQGMNWNVSC